LFYVHNITAKTSSTLKIGFHVPISGGISNSVDNALKMGCNAFQIFTRNPRGWAAKPIEEQEVRNFRKKLFSNSSKIYNDSVSVHMPYLPNLSSSNDKLYEKSAAVLLEELQRCSLLGIPYLVLHFGSNLGQGSEKGLSQFINACAFALEKYESSSSSPRLSFGKRKEIRRVREEKEQEKEKEKEEGTNRVMILVENNAGQRNTIGSRFEDIRLILDKLKPFREKVGVCFDTCHAFAAGYDLRSEESVNTTIDRFDDIIGIRNLKMIHRNDSKDEISSHRDRHEHIGFGKIGKEGFRALCKHKAIAMLPFIMETPKENQIQDLKTVLNLVHTKQKSIKYMT
jgi:deoxyribonuclease IV